MLKGEGNVRRGNTIQVSPKISAYLEGLKLNGIVEERVQDDHLRAPPPKKKKSSPQIRFGTVVTKGAWGPLRANDKDTKRTEIPSPK